MMEEHETPFPHPPSSPRTFFQSFLVETFKLALIWPAIDEAFPCRVQGVASIPLVGELSTSHKATTDYTNRLTPARDGVHGRSIIHGIICGRQEQPGIFMNLLGRKGQTSHRQSKPTSRGLATLQYCCVPSSFQPP